MSHFIPYLQLGAALLLIVLVVLQRSSGDIGGAFGGDGAEFFRTRRGFEKFLFIATIVIAVIFVATSAGVLLLK
ncbi:MAG TPA: preprotein translocase subunit SecG [Candidatus Paceibacterota bacterium]|nr:preprotein translocase subunit SecG [Candidatus Paceibacterota bacterium]